MVASVNNNGELNQLKQQYFEAQRTNDTAAMNAAKRQAMQVMNNESSSEDTVEISERAINAYETTK